MGVRGTSLQQHLHEVQLVTSLKSFDLVIAAARIVDGCGNPWYRGDIGVRGDRIAAIGPPRSLRGDTIHDAEERYAVPGFIDPHTHSDLAMLVHRRAETALLQGVTTQVTGNCGISAAPLAEAHRRDLVRLWDHYGWALEGVAWNWHTFEEYMAELESAGLGINLVPLVGHSALRIAAMGYEQRRPTAAELDHMRRLLDAGMRAGAVGFSTGLVYPPGCYAQTDELEALCEVAARHQGIYATHVRGERETILAADAEAVELGRCTEVPVQISHNAPKIGAPVGEALANLGLVEEARDRGLDVTVDNDLHSELAVRLSRALPQPVLDLDHDDLMALLRDGEGRRRLQEDVTADRYPGAGYSGLLRHGAFDRIVMLQAPADQSLLGLSVAAIASSRGRPAFDTYLDLIVEQEDEAVAIFEYIDPTAIRTLLRHPAAMICSDGLVMPPLDGTESAGDYWPCSYAEYPGILERLVREEGILTLEEAIRKMTSFPAQRFGLFDRGVIRPGMIADIVVLELSRLRDRATNPHPHRWPFENIPPRYPEGIDAVYVAGQLAVDEGGRTDCLSGRLLRRQGAGGRRGSVRRR